MPSIPALCMTEDQRDCTWREDWRSNYGRKIKYLLRILRGQLYRPGNSVVPQCERYYRSPFVVRSSRE